MPERPGRQNYLSFQKNIEYFLYYLNFLISMKYLKGNCGVKMTVFQVLGLSTLFQFLTLSFAGGVFQVRKTTKTKDQNVNRKPPSWNRIACSESGQRLVA